MSYRGEILRSNLLHTLLCLLNPRYIAAFDYDAIVALAKGGLDLDDSLRVLCLEYYLLLALTGLVL